MGRTKQTARKSTVGTPIKQAPARVAAMKALPKTPLKKSTRAMTAKEKKAVAAEAKLDPIELKAKLLAEFEAKMKDMTKQFDEERKMKEAELEFKLAQQHQALLAQMQQMKEAAAAASTALFTIPSSNASVSTASQGGSEMQDEECKESDMASSAAASTSLVSTANTSLFHSPTLSPMVESNRWATIDYSQVCFPSHWPANQTHHVTLENLESTSKDWLRIERMVLETGLPQAKILSIQRIFNRALFARYYMARQRVMEKVGNEHLNNPQSFGNEQLLFHGSRSTPPHLIYGSGDGFDVRCAGQGMLGAGMYFSNSASYSGLSYAHSLNPSTYQYGYNARNNNKQSQPAVPPIFTTAVNPKTGQTVLKSVKVPNNAMQMFLARVTLGTTYDVKKHGNGSYYAGRPPIRPFHCTACKKVVDLEKINIETLKASLIRRSEEDGSAQIEVIEEDEVEEEAKTRAGSKRKKSSTSLANAFAPKRKRGRKSKNQTQTSMTVVSATPSAAATPSVATPPSFSLTAAATTANDDLVSIAPPSPSSAAASASASTAASSATLSCDQQPVCCTHCQTVLGTRASLLSHPYRYDSVTNDHMSVTYQSDLAYPEYLITFQQSAV